MIKAKKIIFFTAFVLLGALAFSLLSIFMQIKSPSSGKINIEIRKGQGAAKVGKILLNAGLIKNYYNFRLVTFLLVADNRLRTGRYLFSPNTPLFMIVRQLIKGENFIELARVTFPEGSSIYKMGKILEKAGVPCAKDFIGLTKKNLEGYLYPDTYFFSNNISAEALSVVMQDRFNEVVINFWVEEGGALATTYDLNQILTLASIIEKEAKLDSERPIISSVFHNRLDLDLPLSACPTVKYALDNPTKIVYYYQLEVDSPYNTYRHKGLPPGPICNPGIKSIKAAVYPAKTDYLYFVAKEDGSHIFTRTEKEHNKVIRKIKNGQLSN